MVGVARGRRGTRNLVGSRGGKEDGPDRAVFVSRLVHAHLPAHKRAPARDNPLSFSRPRSNNSYS